MFKNPRKDWEQFGRDDPFYGVFSSNEYSGKLFDDDSVKRLYGSGDKHVKCILALAARHFDFHPVGDALDFGCGVGRLTLPLAEAFDNACGLDISEGMLSTAREAAKLRGIENVRFERISSGEQIPKARYQFVHTYITLQHMIVSEGERRFNELVGALSDGGVGAIHFTYGHVDGAIAHTLREILKRNAIARGLSNIMKKRAWNYPVMAMSKYSIPKMLGLLSDHGIEKMFLHRVDDWGNYGAFVFFQKSNASASEFSNPRTPGRGAWR